MRIKTVRFVKNNPLVVNALNLILSSGVIAIFGFVFWTVVARSFRSQTVGLATTLLAMSNLISLLGLAGFDSVFMRFLSKSKQRNDQINTGMVFSAATSAILAAVFCIATPLLSPKLSFVAHNGWYLLSFVVFTIFATWNILTNAAIVAYRRTSFIVIINIIFGAVKMVLPFIIRHGGPMTIFGFAGIAQVINVALSVAALVYYFDYVPSLRIKFALLFETWRFGITTYVANVLNLLPDSVLAIIVVDKLGASAAAYFYMAFTIAYFLYTIAFSGSQALLAEVSHDFDNISHYTWKAARTTSYLLIPATIVLIIASPLVLGLFGHDYSHGAASLLRILSLSSIAVMLYSLVGTIFKLTHNLKGLLATTATNAIAIVGLSFWFVKPWGLDGIGWAWLIGSWVSVLVGFWYVRGWFSANRHSTIKV
jgi:O-antigen/teichoic acid export membrane protein